jgi:hypothetical protein
MDFESRPLMWEPQPEKLQSIDKNAARSRRVQTVGISLDSNLRKAFLLSLVFLTACGHAGPPRSLLETRIQWTQDLEADSQEGSVIKTAWELKEQLKRDYVKLIGPPAVFNEMLDLKFTIVVNEMMLEFPEYYESVTRRWVPSQSGPPPDQQQLLGALKILRQRNVVAEERVAATLQAAEKEAMQDPTKRERVPRILAGIVLLTFTVQAWKNEILVVAPAYKYVHGNYVIYRRGSQIIITSPLGPTYFCRTIGRQAAADAVCN